MAHLHAKHLIACLALAFAIPMGAQAADRGASPARNDSWSKKPGSWRTRARTVKTGSDQAIPPDSAPSALADPPMEALAQAVPNAPAGEIRMDDAGKPGSAAPDGAPSPKTPKKSAPPVLEPMASEPKARVVDCADAFRGEDEGDSAGSACPTPESIELYRAKLEERLLERYNNLPEYAGQVGKVSVVLSKPLEPSLDGKLIRAEFDQLVYDNWGHRMPALEKEYYRIVFGAGGVQQVRSDPSIRVGLDMEKTYSEKAPLVAEPFRNVEAQEAFQPTPRVKMPQWWRPDFPELD